MQSPNNKEREMFVTVLSSLSAELMFDTCCKPLSLLLCLSALLSATWCVEVTDVLIDLDTVWQSQPLLHVLSQQPTQYSEKRKLKMAHRHLSLLTPTLLV